MQTVPKGKVTTKACLFRELFSLDILCVRFCVLLEVKDIGFKVFAVNEATLSPAVTLVFSD